MSYNNWPIYSFVVDEAIHVPKDLQVDFNAHLFVPFWRGRGLLAHQQRIRSKSRDQMFSGSDPRLLYLNSYSLKIPKNKIKDTTMDDYVQFFLKKKTYLENNKTMKLQVNHCINHSLDSKSKITNKSHNVTSFLIRFYTDNSFLSSRNGRKERSD